MASQLEVISRYFRRVVLYLQELNIGEPQLQMPIQETRGQEIIEQESHEQRQLSSKLVFRRGSVKMQDQENTAEMESCEQRGFSSRLISRRGSVKIQGQRLVALIQ